jgi:hypothetical protein
VVISATSSPSVIAFLSNASSYEFEVAAINGAGIGAYSSPSAAITP